MQKEEYESLMKNSEILMNFQMTSTNSNNENVVRIHLNINQDEFQYSDTFEWGMNNMDK